MRYVRPKSLTWWAGVGAILLGTLGMIYPAKVAVSQLSTLLATLIGASDGSPAMLILTGIGLIGIRDKLERMA